MIVGEKASLIPTVPGVFIGIRESSGELEVPLDPSGPRPFSLNSAGLVSFKI